MTSTSVADLANGRRPPSPVAEFGRFMDKLKPQMALALPKHLNADRMYRLGLTAFSSTPALQQCTFQSIAASIMTAAQLGLEPGILGQGYLIPYKTTCTFVPGWKGLVDLVARAGRATVWTGAVYEGDAFDYELGDAPFVKHKPNPEGITHTVNDAGERVSTLRFVYAIGRVRDAQMPVVEVWGVGKVERHLRQFNKVGGRHYALTSDSNFEMYARKVALLQVLKYMPSSVELSAAIAVSNAAEEGKGMVLDGDFVSTVTDEDTGEITPVTQTENRPAPASNAEAKPEVKTAGASYAQLADKLTKAKGADAAAQILDEARSAGLNAEHYAELVAIYEKAYP